MHQHSKLFLADFPALINKVKFEQSQSIKILFSKDNQSADQRSQISGLNNILTWTVKIIFLN